MDPVTEVDPMDLERLINISGPWKNRIPPFSKKVDVLLDDDKHLFEQKTGETQFQHVQRYL